MPAGEPDNGVAVIHVETAPREISARKLGCVRRMTDTCTAREVGEMEPIGVRIDQETRRAIPSPGEVRANGTRFLGEMA